MIGRLTLAAVSFWAAPAWASDIGHEVADQVDLASYQHYLDDLLYTHDGNNRNALSGPDKGPARDNIVATFESFGLDVELEPFTYQGTTCYNVIATQLGTAHPDAYFVIGAHYDSSGSPGADDNASGVAGVLEIARILSACESEYTIKYMAFDAEEYGTRGSDYYVDNYYYDDIRGMISLDMIAWNTGSNKAEVYGFSSCAAIKIALGSAIAQYGQGLTPGLFSETTSRSDHGPFQSAGFQACLLIEGSAGSNPCYHTACDSVDNTGYINYVFAVKMTRSVAGYLADNALVFYPIDCETGQGCELGVNGDKDCNANGIWDHCDVRCGTSEDVNLNGVPDECEPHETWYVNCADCPGPGSGSEADPFCTIQAAINAAANGMNAVVEIIVADGIYTGAGNKDLDFGGKLITLRSANGAASCIIDCEGSGRGFYFHSGETAAAVVNGLTIRNGSVDSGNPGEAYGGGVFCSSASPTVSNCIISGNTASSGGGVWCYYSSPTLEECSISSNSGCGVRCIAGNPALTGCTISGNTASGSYAAYGAGVYCSSSSPTLTGCTISGNTASGSYAAYGAGVYCSSSSPTLTGCTISGNTASGSSAAYGAGVYCSSSSPTLTGCTINGNTATAAGTNSKTYGGGVYCSSSGPMLNNCTISENTLTGTNRHGGGVYCDQSSPSLSDCSIAGNQADSGGVHCGSSSSPILSGCTINGNSGTGVYCVASSEPTLTDCTISSNAGRGVDCDSSNPTLTNCLVANNSSGGVYCKSANPTFAGCMISANASHSGVRCDSSSPTLTDCTISGNTASYNGGGGVYCSSSDPVLTNCSIIANTTTGHSGGGGMYCSSSNPTLVNCTISHNTTSGNSRYGGGIYCDNSSPVLTNCTIIANTTTGSSGHGGGLYCSFSNPTLVNCTISGNVIAGASALGGGVYCASASSSPSLTNCILWGDTPQEIYVHSGTPVVTYSDIQGGYAGTGNTDVEPGFAFSDDCYLLPGSPCIDAGTNEPTSGLPSQDADGNARPQDGDGDGLAVADMGAYEFNSSVPTIALSPATVDLLAYAGEASPMPLTLSIRNCGGGVLDWRIIEDCSWLSVDPPTGSCMEEIDFVNVHFDTTGFAIGDYSCDFVVAASGAVNTPRVVAVTLHFGTVRRVPSDYSTIQAAISAAAERDWVLVGDGIWTGAGNKDLDFGGKVIRVSSLNGLTTCIIDCQGSGRGFYFHRGETADAVVEGFTVRNGNVTGSSPGGAKGGGVYCSGSKPTLMNCLLTQNTASAGGGLYCSSSRPTVTGCTIEENTAGLGGGVYCESSSTPTLTNCAISRNTAASDGGGIICRDSSVPTLTGCEISENTAGGSSGSGCGGGVYCGSSNAVLRNCMISRNAATGSSACGGGVYCTDSSPAFSNCAFIANTAAGTGFYNDIGGGGLYLLVSNPILSSCTIDGNVAIAIGESGSQGGGVFCESSNPTLTNCTISQNMATGIFGDGGGVFCESSNPTLTNCTISQNKAIGVYGYGGGVYAYSSSSPVLANCILWGDTPEEIDADDGGAPLVTYSNVQGGWAGTGNLDIDPRLAFADDFHLMPDSPCIDAGTNNPSGGLPAEDVDGNPRPLDGDGDGQAVADMGAYEFTPLSPSIALSPSTIDRIVYAGAPSSEPLTLLIRNCGGGVLDWQITEDCSWLAVDPPSGSCRAGTNSIIVIGTTGLAVGDYSCTLAVSAPGAVNSPQIVPVALHVGAVRRVPSEYPTIQEAIDAAAKRDWVLVSDGIWTGAGNNNLDFGGKAIKLSSLNGAASCVIDCEKSGRGFYFHTQETASAIIEGLTIRNGKATSSSPGGSYGGAVYCSGASPTLMNCLISQNTASSGGGLYCKSSSSPTLANCTISGNTATSAGGGVYCLGCSLPSLTNCGITGNAASSGGALYCYDSSGPVLANCTISGNSATYDGGGLYCAKYSSFRLANCILWADMPQEIYLWGSGDEPVVTYSDIQGGWTGTGNLNTDPLFVNAANGDFHLASNSPCIDAGDPASDYSLEPEPDGGRINMGAYGNTAEAESKGGLYIQGYNLVEKTRVGRTLWDYRLSVRVKNESATDATAVSLELLHMPSNVTIIDGLVDVGFVPGGGTKTSTDTFIIRVDRRTLISELGISWRVTYALGGVREERTFAGSLDRQTLEPSYVPAEGVPLPVQNSAADPPGRAGAATIPN